MVLLGLWRCGGDGGGGGRGMCEFVGCSREDRC